MTCPSTAAPFGSCIDWGNILALLDAQQRWAATKGSQCIGDDFVHRGLTGSDQYSQLSTRRYSLSHRLQQA
jgi:hypothetical protein